MSYTAPIVYCLYWKHCVQRLLGIRFRAQVLQGTATVLPKGTYCSTTVGHGKIFATVPPFNVAHQHQHQTEFVDQLQTRMHKRLPEQALKANFSNSS